MMYIIQIYYTEIWKDLFNNNNEEEIALPENLSEPNLWDQPVYEQKYKQLLDAQSTTSEKARLLAVASPHASDWLAALPAKRLGLKLDNPSMRLVQHVVYA